MKKVKLFEQFVNEAKMPDKLIGNDEIVFLKTKEDSRGAHYNLYYKGHDIEKGGARFGSEKELKAFADDYILSNQWYNKLKYEDSKPLPESVDMDDLENAKEQLSNPHTILDITYDKTRSGDKFVRFDYENKYVPGKMLDSGPHFVKVFYDNNKDLKKISKELNMDLKESVVTEKISIGTIPKGMKKQDFKDVINGDQVELIDKGGKRFGSTTEADNHEVFWINGKQNRELLKKIGEREFIKQLKKIYDIDVKEVM